MEKYFKEQLNWLKNQGHYNPHSERDRYIIQNRRDTDMVSVNTCIFCNIPRKKLTCSLCRRGGGGGEKKSHYEGEGMLVVLFGGTNYIFW